MIMLKVMIMKWLINIIRINKWNKSRMQSKHQLIIKKGIRMIRIVRIIRIVIRIVRI